MQDLGALRARLLFETQQFSAGMQHARNEMRETRNTAITTGQAIGQIGGSSPIISPQQLGSLSLAQRELLQTTLQARTTNVALHNINNTQIFGPTVTQNITNVNNHLNNTSNAANNASHSINKLHNASMTFATAVGVTFAAATVVAANFEQKMKDVEAVSGSTGEEMKMLGDLAKEMGEKTAFSASEAAMGIEELVKAGLTVEQIIKGGLQGALDLATAGNLELAAAAEIASTALNAFKDDNLSVVDAANILAGAANASATDVGELKFGLSAVSAVAAGVGLSFKDTATSLASFAQNGLKGSDAGTSLKTMLMNLQPTTEKQIDLFTELGLLTKDGANAFYDMNGSIKSMPEIAGILQKAMKDMTDQQRGFALEVMFGSDAIRAGNILYKEGADGLNKMWGAMSKVTAADVAKVKLDSLKGSFEELKGVLETLGIEIGEEFLPVLTQITRHATSVLRSFDDLDMANIKAGLAFAGTSAAVLLLGTSLLKIVNMSKILFASMGPAGWLILGVSLLAGAVVGAKTSWDDLNEVNLKHLDTMIKTKDEIDGMVTQFDTLKAKSKLTVDEFARWLDIQTLLNKTADPTIIAALTTEAEQLQIKSGLSNDELQKMVGLNDQLIEKVPQATQKITDQGNAVLENTSKIKALSAAKYEDIKAEAERQLTNLEGKIAQNLETEKRLILEIKGAKDELNSADGEHSRLVRERTEMYKAMKQAEKDGNNAIAEQLKYELFLKDEDIAKQQIKVDGLGKEIQSKNESLDKTQKELGKLDEIYWKLNEVELKRVGINGKKQEGINQLDLELARLTTQREIMGQIVPKDELHRKEHQAATAALDSQISNLQSARDKINENIQRARELNSTYGQAVTKNVTINEYTVTQKPVRAVESGRNRGTYHTGGVIEKPKLHVGGLASQFMSAPMHNEIDIRALPNEMMLTESQQANLFRMIDAGFVGGGANTKPLPPSSDKAINVNIAPAPVVIDKRVLGEIIYEVIDEISAQNTMRSRRFGGDPLV